MRGGEQHELGLLGVLPRFWQGAWPSLLIPPTPAALARRLPAGHSLGRKLALTVEFVYLVINMVVGTW